MEALSELEPVEPLPGPHEVEFRSTTVVVEGPQRNFDCDNYTTCLNLAAALNWESFSCSRCNGTINQQLLWRAYNKIRNDKDLGKLCDLASIKRSASANAIGIQKIDVFPAPFEQLDSNLVQIGTAPTCEPALETAVPTGPIASKIIELRSPKA